MHRLVERRTPSYSEMLLYLERVYEVQGFEGLREASISATLRWRDLAPVEWAMKVMSLSFVVEALDQYIKGLEEIRYEHGFPKGA